MIPACPSLMRTFNKGNNKEATYVLYNVCVGIDFCGLIWERVYTHVKRFEMYICLLPSLIVLR